MHIAVTCSIFSGPIIWSFVRRFSSSSPRAPSALPRAMAHVPLWDLRICVHEARECMEECFDFMEQLHQLSLTCMRNEVVWVQHLYLE